MIGSRKNTAMGDDFDVFGMELFSDARHSIDRRHRITIPQEQVSLMPSLSLHETSFSPVDMVSALLANAGLTMYAAESDTFRIPTPFIGEKIEEMVGENWGWIGDARTILTLAAIGLAHFGTKPRMDGTQLISDRVARACHDVAAGAATSLIATEICRAKTGEGSGNMDMLGLDDGLLDDDLVGEYEESEIMDFALAW